jgi:hypothetical protein
MLSARSRFRQGPVYSDGHMRTIRVLVSVCLLAGAVVLASPSAGAVPLGCTPIPGGYRCISGPYFVEPGENHFQGLVPAPPVAGYVTSARATLVYGTGAPVPHHFVHLHHAVWINPAEIDLTCPQLPDRFFATGKERTPVTLPSGYGYRWSNEPPTDFPTVSPTWAVVAELDGGHPGEVVEAYLQLDVGFVDAPEGALTAVTPVWFDVRNCQQDPVFDVPRRPRRHRFRERWTYTMPVGGAFVAMAGHLHDGGKKISLTRMAAGEGLFTSRARYDRPKRPWYLTRMTGFSGTPGLSVAPGEALQLTAVYSSSRRWDDVMGIMIGMLAPPP